jgi:hypothetical protein
LDDVDAHLTHMLLGPDSGEHQQLWRPDRTSGQHHFTLRGAVSGEALACLCVFDAGAPAVVHPQSAYQRFGDDDEIGPAEDRPEVGVGGALPDSVDNVDVTPADAGLHTAGDVTGSLVSDFHGGFDARTRHRVGHR